MIVSKALIEEQLTQILQREDSIVSEAQLKYALAWELQSALPQGYHIYLEYPVRMVKDNENEKRLYYDIVIKYENKYCVIELKFKTSNTKVFYDGKEFEFKNHYAQDLGRFDFLKDVERIEFFKDCNKETFDCGYAVMVTNDRLYWESKGKNTKYENFALYEGRENVSNHLKWNNPNKQSVGEKRVNGIQLKANYKVEWSKANDKNKFKYLIFTIQ